MGLVKRTYVAQETVITAENLNDIQDAIIENQEAIGDVDEALTEKVDKVTGKGLSTNDFTNTYKGQLDGYQVASIAETKNFLGIT
jgi:hypothetical protein